MLTGNQVTLRVVKFQVGEKDKLGQYQDALNEIEQTININKISKEFFKREFPLDNRNGSNIFVPELVDVIIPEEADNSTNSQSEIEDDKEQKKRKFRKQNAFNMDANAYYVTPYGPG